MELAGLHVCLWSYNYYVNVLLTYCTVELCLLHRAANRPLAGEPLVKIVCWQKWCNSSPSCMVFHYPLGLCDSNAVTVMCLMNTVEFRPGAYSRGGGGVEEVPPDDMNTENVHFMD